MEQAISSNTVPAARAAQALPAWESAIERDRAGDAAGAIVLYERHLKRNPQDAPAWMNLGAALRRTGRHDAALVCYQRALRLRPQDAAVWSNLGNHWKEMGEHEQALRCHGQASGTARCCRTWGCGRAASPPRTCSRRARASCSMR